MLLKFAALNSDVWKYINPETPLDKLPKLIEPVRPTLTFVRAMKLSTLSTPDSSSTPTEAEDPVRLTKSQLTNIKKDVLKELIDEYTPSYKKFLV